MNAKEVLEFAKKNNVKIVDLRFTDFPGQWQHCSYPISEIDEGTFEDGMGFDGSSIRGWKAINESDMLMVPDPTTAFIDPFFEHPTLSLICNIQDPITREPYSRDPRWIARKAEKYLKSTGIGDTAYFGPEAEFFIFNDARFSSGPRARLLQLDSVEGTWNTGRDEGGRNLALQAPPQGGLLPGPADRQPAGHPQRDGADDGEDRHPGRGAAPRGGDRRSGRDRHAVHDAGQDGRPAAQVQVRRQERRAQERHDGARSCRSRCSATTARACTCHQSIWKGGKPLFAGDGYAGLSEMGLHYIGGMLKHARAIARSPTRPRTRTSGWCRATRRR